MCEIYCNIVYEICYRDPSPFLELLEFLERLPKLDLGFEMWNVYEYEDKNI